MKKTKLFTIFILFNISSFAQEWNIQHEEPGGNRLRSVSFVSENIGYAAGENGKILKTTDGETWNDISLSTPTNIFSVYFTDANTGFIAGSQGLLKKTIDGGLNWVDQVIETDKSLMCVSFLDSNLGFAVGRGGTILKTINGGENWEDLTKLNFSKNINYLHFVDLNTIFIGVDEESSNLFKTINGGQDWIQIQNVFSGPISSIHFTDKDNGFITSELGKVSKTIDGGENWQQKNGKTGWDFHSVNFIDKNNGYLVGHLGTIRRTTDGGENWEEESSGITDILYAVTSIENSVYIVGTQSKILKKVLDTGSLSIDERSKSNDVLIYPTLTSGKIEVSTNLPEAFTIIEIIDLHGRKVQSININLTTSKTFRLNSSLQNGLYFVQIVTDNLRVSKKIILKK